MSAEKFKYRWCKAIRAASKDELGPIEKAVAQAMAVYADEDGFKVFPGARKLMDDTSYSRAAVERARRSLVAKGWLRLVRPGGSPDKSKKVTNLYCLTFPQLQADSTQSEVVGLDDYRLREHDYGLTEHDYRPGEARSISDGSKEGSNSGSFALLDEDDRRLANEIASRCKRVTKKVIAEAELLFEDYSDAEIAVAFEQYFTDGYKPPTSPNVLRKLLEDRLHHAS